jgi:hypothetical protein
LKTFQFTILSIFILTSVAYSGRILDGTNWFQEIGATDSFGDAYPVSAAGWARADVGTSAETLWFWGDNNASGEFLRINLRGDLDPNLVEVSRARSGVFSATQGTYEFTTDEWYHIAGVFASATSATIYINGANTVEDTNNIAYPSDANTLALGISLRATPANTLKGGLAHWTMWDSALTAGNISDLAGGDIPTTIDAGNIISYWKLEEPGSWFDAQDEQSVHPLTRAGSPGVVNASHLLDDPGPDGQENVIVTTIGM